MVRIIRLTETVSFNDGQYTVNGLLFSDGWWQVSVDENDIYVEITNEDHVPFEATVRIDNNGWITVRPSLRCGTGTQDGENSWEIVEWDADSYDSVGHAIDALHDPRVCDLMDIVTNIGLYQMYAFLHTMQLGEPGAVRFRDGQKFGPTETASD